MTYEGYRKNGTYRAFANGLPLELHRVYTQSRAWLTETGMKQLSFDIFFHFLQDQPSNVPNQDYMFYGETRLACWRPHTAYLPLLRTVVRMTGSNTFWRIQADQLQLWLDDWIAETRNTSNGLSYDAWLQEIDQRIGRRGIMWLGAGKLFNHYLDGYDIEAAIRPWMYLPFEQRYEDEEASDDNGYDTA